MKRNAPLGYLIAAIAACVWAWTSPGIAFLLDRGVPSLTIALWRDVFIVAFLFTAFALAQPSVLRVDRASLRQLGIAGVISIGIYHALWVWSVLLNGAAVAVVLIYLYPTFVALGSWLLHRERITSVQWIALIISLLGCALVVRAYDPALLRLNALGLVVGLLTAVTHTVYVLFNQRRVNARGLSPWTSLTYTMGFGALALVVITAVLRPADLAPPSDPALLLVLLVLGIGPTLGGYALFTLSLRYAPATIASLIVVLEVPIAALIAVALLGEQLEALQIVGMVLVLAAAMLPGLLEELHTRRGLTPQGAAASGSK